MNNYLALGLATLTIVLNRFIGHFFYPKIILLTPVVLIITSSLICFGTKNLKIISISLLTFIFVVLNDVSIRLFSGEGSSSEGRGWVSILLFIGLIPTIAILLTAILKRKQDRATNKVIGITAFIGLAIIYLYSVGN